MNKFLRIVVALCGLFASTNAFTTPNAPAVRSSTALNIVDPAIVAMVEKSDPAGSVIMLAGFVAAWELLTPGRAKKGDSLNAPSPKEYLLSKTWKK